MKEIKHGGKVVATEADQPGEKDMICLGLQEGRYLDGTDVLGEEPDDFDMVPAKFSLVCSKCSADYPAGLGITSREQASVAGWTEIQFRPEMSDRNYEGVCPECSKPAPVDLASLKPTMRQATASLISQICPVCGKPKRTRMTMCGGCYHSLPRDLAKALYKPVGNGYEQAFAGAMFFKKVAKPIFPPSAEGGHQ